MDWKEGSTLLLYYYTSLFVQLFSVDLGIHLVLIGGRIHHHRAHYTSLVRKYGQTFTRSTFGLSTKPLTIVFLKMKQNKTAQYYLVSHFMFGQNLFP